LFLGDVEDFKLLMEDNLSFLLGPRDGFRKFLTCNRVPVFFLAGARGLNWKRRVSKEAAARRSERETGKIENLLFGVQESIHVYFFLSKGPCSLVGYL
jgi:hypothetical protein